MEQQQMESVNEILGEVKKTISEFCTALNNVTIAINGDAANLSNAYIAKRVNELNEQIERIHVGIAEGDKRITELDTSVNLLNARVNKAAAIMKTIIGKKDANTTD